MAENTSFTEQIRAVLDPALSLSARAIIPALAIVAIWQAHATGMELPPELALIAGFAGSALATQLAKFDRSDRAAKEITSTFEEIIQKSTIEEALRNAELQAKLNDLFKRFDILVVHHTGN